MRCRHCGEPWDLDSIHEEISAHHGAEIELMRQRYGDRYWSHTSGFQAEYERRYFDPAVTTFREQGCAYFGCPHGDMLKSEQSAVIDVIAELSGSDVDGAESDLEMAEAMGLL